MTVTFGKGRTPEAWPDDVAKRLRKKGVDPDQYPPAELREAVLARHPILRDLRGITWARLQFVESLILIHAMRSLNASSIVALPVHDSLIVPRPARDQATQALLRAGVEVQGVKLLLS